jgi:hypothetical protein
MFDYWCHKVNNATLSITDWQALSNTSLQLSTKLAVGGKNGDASEVCEIGSFLLTLPNLPSYCLECPTGKYTTEAGQTRCKVSAGTTSCPAGKFAEVQPLTMDDGSLEVLCMSCPPGRYQPHVHMKACQLCPLQQFQHEYGQPECGYCPRGRLGSRSRTACCNPLVYGDEACDGSVPSPLTKAELAHLTHFPTPSPVPPTPPSMPNMSFIAPEAITDALNSELSSLRGLKNSVHEDETQTTSCKAGKYSKSVFNHHFKMAIVYCLACPLGKFQARSSQWRCQLCPAGKLTNSFNTSCKNPSDSEDSTDIVDKAISTRHGSYNSAVRISHHTHMRAQLAALRAELAAPKKQYTSFGAVDVQPGKVMGTCQETKCIGGIDSEGYITKPRVFRPGGPSKNESGFIHCGVPLVGNCKCYCWLDRPNASTTSAPKAVSREYKLVKVPILRPTCEQPAKVSFLADDGCIQCHTNVLLKRSSHCHVWCV